VYWVLYGLNPASGGIEEGKVPAGAVGGKNDYGRTDWAEPCPPYGPRKDLPYALSGKVLAQAQLTGKYARQR
jgi:phosphatidylethanolamine-binding protein (PEBP) family uncharacterized protein